jgi:hypothetical protein
MAVVKLRYSRSKPQMKAHLRYIMHRRGEREGSITRTLFDKDGLSDKQAVYNLIDSASRGTLFYKIMLNFDPVREDTYKDLDIQHITRQTISHLGRLLGRDLQFVATVHNADHTPLRHVHGFFLVQGRLSREKFRELRKTAYKSANREARLLRAARDRVMQNPRYRSLTRHHAYMQSLRKARAAMPHKRRSLQSGCSSCGYGQLTGIAINRIFCPNCNASLKPNLSQRRRFDLAR